jgi:hypothetical protein
LLHFFSTTEAGAGSVHKADPFKIGAGTTLLNSHAGKVNISLKPEILAGGETRRMPAIA